MDLYLNRPVYALVKRQGASLFLAGVIHIRNSARSFTIRVTNADSPYDGQFLPVTIANLYPRFNVGDHVSMLTVANVYLHGQIIKIYRRSEDNMPVYRCKPYSYQLLFDYPLTESRTHLELLP